MLEGIGSNPIIAGAYANRDGICPMLAAHRAGGRTSVIAFAKAWDRFVFRGARRTRPRRVTERELLILKVYLQASLLGTSAYGAELERAKSSAIERVEHRGHVQPAIGSEPPEPSERPERPGDPDRSAELAASDGWAWTRVVSRYDDYERVLRQLGSEPPAQVDDGGQRVLSR